MKYIYKNWWKIALVLIVAGFALSALGFAFGARGGYAFFEDGRLRIVSSDENIIVREMDVAQFDVVEVKTGSASIELIASDSYGFEISLPQYVGKPSWSITDGKLAIDASSQANMFSIVNFNIASHYVKVYYPVGNASVLKSVDLTASSGGILLQGVSAESISLKASSGSISAEVPYYRQATARNSSGSITFNGNGDNASLILVANSGTIRADSSGCAIVDISNSSGSITLSGDTLPSAEVQLKASSGTIRSEIPAWQSLTAKNTSGSINIIGQPHGNTSASVSSGSITMTLNGDESDFSYDMSTTSGTIRIGGQRIGSPARYSSDTAGNTLMADATSGSIRVDFIP